MKASIDRLRLDGTLATSKSAIVELIAERLKELLVLYDAVIDT